MQRNKYPVNSTSNRPAVYPPQNFANPPHLHHPVPQHVSSLPHIRSPPPTPLPATSSYANLATHPIQVPHPNLPGASQLQHPQYGGGQYTATGMASTQAPQPPSQQHGFTQHASGRPGEFVGDLMRDPVAHMGIHMGKTAWHAGQEYLEQNVNRYVSVNALKFYFDVSNSYVLNKLFILLFPWRHRPWSRQQRFSHSPSEPIYLPPSQDINSPDMYIPLMASITYVLVCALFAGIRGAFHPELLGSTAGTAFLVVMFELFGLKLAFYLFNVTRESQILDLLAYSGYKFVGVIVTLVISGIFNRGRGAGGLVGWIIFLYTYAAYAFFLLRSMRYVILQDPSSQSVNAGSSLNYMSARAQRNRRTQILAGHSFFIQFVLMWVLLRQKGGDSR